MAAEARNDIIGRAGVLGAGRAAASRPSSSNAGSHSRDDKAALTTTTTTTSFPLDELRGLSIVDSRDRGNGDHRVEEIKKAEGGQRGAAKNEQQAAGGSLQENSGSSELGSPKASSSSSSPVGIAASATTDQSSSISTRPIGDGDGDGADSTTSNIPPITTTTASTSTSIGTSRLPVPDLRARLAEMGLETRGKREVLIRRLRRANAASAARRRPENSGGNEEQAPDNGNGNGDSSSNASPISRPSWYHREMNQRRSHEVPVGGYRRFLVLDVEATCVADKSVEWPNEIIEWPVILLGYADDQSSSTSESGQPNGHLSGDDDERSPSASTADSELPSPLVTLSQFHSYVRPRQFRTLSPFAKSLTGIQQTQVDEAPEWPEVVARFEDWLNENELFEDEEMVVDDHESAESSNRSSSSCHSRNLRSDVCWATDGPWDLRDFVPKQHFITPSHRNMDARAPPPAYFVGPYINVKEAVQTVLSEQWYLKNDPHWPKNNRLTTAKRAVNPRRTTGGSSSRRKSPGFYTNIAGQLQALGLSEFSGRQHSGIDDARNIGRVLVELARRGVALEPNGNLPAARFADKKWPWMGSKPGQVLWDRRDLEKL